MKEVRNINNSDIVVDEESRTVEGYAVVFNSQSEDLGFYEVIHDGAITDDTIKNSDIFAKFNHDDSKVLARSKYGVGSLALQVDETGVRYLFEAPHTALGDELLEHLKRGDIDSSSFAFTVADGGDTWRNEGGKIYRDIYSIDRLYDISPVWQPAYSQTVCSARSKEMVEKAEQLEAHYNILLQEVDELCK